MKITINLTQDDQEGNIYTIQSLTGTCQLAIGQKVSKDRVSGWCTMAQVNVRITGITQEPETQEQLDLCLGDPIQKQLQAGKGRGKGRKSPSKPAGSFKALPAPDITIAK